MKTNAAGKRLIEEFLESYDAAETIRDAEKAVNLYVSYKLNSNQFSALVSLVMCIGIDEFAKSKLLARLNEDLPFKAAKYFDHYAYLEDDEGVRKFDQELAYLRDLEKALFLMPEVIK